MDFLVQYLVQTVFHSLVIALVIEGVMGLWRVREPSSQVRFRFLALLLPVVFFPLYSLAYPQRLGMDFHKGVALIDSDQWLGLGLASGLGGGVTIGHLFWAVLVLTTLLFAIKEGIPSLRYYLWSRPVLPPIGRGQFPKLDAALAGLALATSYPGPTVLLSPEDSPVVHSLGHQAIVVSASAIEMLDREELEAVLAHELAHLKEQDSLLTKASLAFRFFMFYNPVAFLVFRRIVSDREKICDDMAVSFTGKRLALASGLLKVFRRGTASSAPAAMPAEKREWPLPRISALESQACSELVKERVRRMVGPDRDGGVSYPYFRMGMVVALLAALLFYVV